MSVRLWVDKGPSGHPETSYPWASGMSTPLPDKQGSRDRISHPWPSIITKTEFGKYFWVTRERLSAMHGNQCRLGSEKSHCALRYIRDWALTINHTFLIMLNSGFFIYTHACAHAHIYSFREVWLSILKYWPISVVILQILSCRVLSKLSVYFLPG